MKNTVDKEKFIKMRADGFSYDAIAEKLGISKPTLIKWNKELSREVSNLFYFQVEKILEQYKQLKIHRIEVFAAHLQKAQDELAKRDYTDLPTKDLVALITTLKSQLSQEVGSIEFHTGEVVAIDLIGKGFTEEITLKLPY